MLECVCVCGIRVCECVCSIKEFQRRTFKPLCANVLFVSFIPWIGDALSDVRSPSAHTVHYKMLAKIHMKFLLCILTN